MTSRFAWLLVGSVVLAGCGGDDHTSSPAIAGGSSGSSGAGHAGANVAGHAGGAGASGAGGTSLGGAGVGGTSGGGGGAKAGSGGASAGSGGASAGAGGSGGTSGGAAGTGGSAGGGGNAGGSGGSIDCASNPCGANETCTNADGSFTCACPSDYLVDASGACLVRVAKVDLVIEIGNAAGMADAQAPLAAAIGEFLTRLANPRCVGADGAPTVTQPATGQDACESGATREHAPVTDLHVGIVSSSLGGHGSDACPDADAITCPGGTNTSANDHGHLVSRLDPCSSLVAPTYGSRGYLAFDPLGQATPPGTKDIASIGSSLGDMIRGVGQIGCAYGSPLESWYRFLVDPTPYATISLASGQATVSGVDLPLLDQRAQFLRPDSLVVVLMLDDHDDCSIKEYGQYPLFLQQELGGKAFHLPPPRSVCAASPNDPCCASCGQQVPDNCADDPACVPALGAADDQLELRCFDQKRRFGLDALNPTSRYVSALTESTVPDVNGAIVPNPLYAHLVPTDGLAMVRDPGMVLLAGLVGAPWQDLAKNPTSYADGPMSADELADASAGPSRWDVVAGNPSTYVAPLDPLTTEDWHVRSGTDPVTGDAIAPPAQSDQNPMNGNDFTVPAATPNELQYACVFPLTAPRDCAASGATGCACVDPANDKPICAVDPMHGGGRTSQTRARAYPGLRQLAVLEGVGAQAVVGSICAEKDADPSAIATWYQPALDALHARMATRLLPGK